MTDWWWFRNWPKVKTHYCLTVKSLQQCALVQQHHGKTVNSEVICQRRGGFLRHGVPELIQVSSDSTVTPALAHCSHRHVDKVSGLTVVQLGPPLQVLHVWSVFQQFTAEAVYVKIFQIQKSLQSHLNQCNGILQRTAAASTKMSKKPPWVCQIWCQIT